MRVQRLNLLAAAALALPLFLSGCGKEEPIDPCKKLEKNVMGKDVSEARDHAYLFVERRKKSISRQYEHKIKFDAPTITCSMPKDAVEPEKPKKADTPDDPWKKKKPVKPKQAVCVVVLPYCSIK
jgi:hypothetical protein